VTTLRMTHPSKTKAFARCGLGLPRPAHESPQFARDGTAMLEHAQLPVTAESEEDEVLFA
jgi:hypothetical protein